MFMIGCKYFVLWNVNISKDFLKIVLYLHSNCTAFVFGGANDDGEGSVELCLPTSV